LKKGFEKSWCGKRLKRGGRKRSERSRRKIERKPKKKKQAGKKMWACEKKCAQYGVLTIKGRINGQGSRI